MAALPKTPYPISQNDIGMAPDAETSPLRRSDMIAVAERTGADLIGRIDDVLRYLKDRPAHVPSAPNLDAVGLERIAHLQASAAQLQRDVAQMRTEVREIRERHYRLQDRVMRLPTKWSLAASVLVVLAAIFGATAYQRQLQALVDGTLLFADHAEVEMGRHPSP